MTFTGGGASLDDVKSNAVFHHQPEVPEPEPEIKEEVEEPARPEHGKMQNMLVPTRYQQNTQTVLTFIGKEALQYKENPHCGITLAIKQKARSTTLSWAAVVAQLVERLLSIPKVRGSNPAIGNIYIEHLFSDNCI